MNKTRRVQKCGAETKRHRFRRFGGGQNKVVNRFFEKFKRKDRRDQAGSGKQAKSSDCLEPQGLRLFDVEGEHGEGPLMRACLTDCREFMKNK